MRHATNRRVEACAPDAASAPLLRTMSATASNCEHQPSKAMHELLSKACNVMMHEQNVTIPVVVLHYSAAGRHRS